MNTPLPDRVWDSVRVPDRPRPMTMISERSSSINDMSILCDVDHPPALFSAITAPSLASQDDQDFQWVVLIDEDLPDDIQGGLAAAIRPLGDRAALYPSKRHSPIDLAKVAAECGFSRNCDPSCGAKRSGCGWRCLGSKTTCSATPRSFSEDGPSGSLCIARSCPGMQ